MTRAFVTALAVLMSFNFSLAADVGSKVEKNGLLPQDKKSEFVKPVLRAVRFADEFEELNKQAVELRNAIEKLKNDVKTLKDQVMSVTEQEKQQNVDKKQAKQHFEDKKQVSEIKKVSTDEKQKKSEYVVPIAETQKTSLPQKVSSSVSTIPVTSDLPRKEQKKVPDNSKLMLSAKAVDTRGEPVFIKGLGEVLFLSEGVQTVLRVSVALGGKASEMLGNSVERYDRGGYSYFVADSKMFKF